MIPNFTQRELVLASASPRRLELLRQIGLEPLVRVQPAEETQDLAAYGPRALVELNARRKAEAARDVLADSIVIAADTVVICAEQLFGKPRDAAQAARMLARLSGGWHCVYTGLCLLDTANATLLCGSRATEVRFAPLTQEQIAAYVESGEPLDKAGAYGIQGLGGLFVEEIRGDYSTVVGLSLPLLRELAAQL